MTSRQFFFSHYIFSFYFLIKKSNLGEKALEDKEDIKIQIEKWNIEIVRALVVTQAPHSSLRWKALGWEIVSSNNCYL